MNRLYKMNSMKGMGDNIYQRAFLKTLSRDAICTLDTPWPEIYEDLSNVYFDPCSTNLRTQKKNVKRTDYCGRRSADITHRLRVSNLGQLRYLDQGIMKGLQERFRCEPEPIDLPSFKPSERITHILSKKYAIIRPITIRTEWHSAARNPLPEYLAQAIAILKEQGYTTVSIADVDGVNEMFVGEKPDCDIEYNAGELNIREILCLIEHAALVVGGIGWAVPACYAYRTKSVFIGGGWGTYNHPDRLKPGYDVPEVSFLLPDNFCMCRKSDHDCDKTISNFNKKFKDLL